MSGCTLRFTRDSPLRTALVDEATGHVKYQIDTPVKVSRSVTRIRKFDSPVQPRLHRDEDADPDSGDDITNTGGEKEKPKAKKDKEDMEGGGTGTGPPEAGDEIARIYRKWFSSDRIVFQGRITSRREFLPKCGKMKG